MRNWEIKKGIARSGSDMYYVTDGKIVITTPNYWGAMGTQKAMQSLEDSGYIIEITK